MKDVKLIMNPISAKRIVQLNKNIRIFFLRLSSADLIREKHFLIPLPHQRHLNSASSSCSLARQNILQCLTHLHHLLSKMSND